MTSRLGATHTSNALMTIESRKAGGSMSTCPRRIVCAIRSASRAVTGVSALKKRPKLLDSNGMYVGGG